MKADTAVMNEVERVNIFIINKKNIITIAVINTGKNTMRVDRPSWH